MAVRALYIKDPHPTTSELRGIYLFGINIKHAYRAQLLPPPDRQLTAPIRETILLALHFEKGTAEIQKEDLAILVDHVVDLVIDDEVRDLQRVLVPLVIDRRRLFPIGIEF